MVRINSRNFGRPDVLIGFLSLSLSLSLSVFLLGASSTIRVWETQTWGCEKLLEDHAGPVYALTVLEGKLVSIATMPSGPKIRLVHTHPLHSASSSISSWPDSPEENPPTTGITSSF